MSTPTPLARGKRHNIAAIALDHYRSGQSERDALDNAIAGKSVNAADRESIEIELRGMIDGAASDRAESGPGLAVVPDSDREPAPALDHDGPIVPPPGALEHDAAVERIASGAARAPRQRRSLAERRAEKAEALLQAERAVERARHALRAVDLLELADLIALDRRGTAAARMIRASVRSNLIDQASAYVLAGADAIGLVIDPDLEIGATIDWMIDTLTDRANGVA